LNVSRRYPHASFGISVRVTAPHFATIRVGDVSGPVTIGSAMDEMPDGIVPRHTNVLTSASPFCAEVVRRSFRPGGGFTAGVVFAHGPSHENSP
jgi:hypothetical protein